MMWKTWATAMGLGVALTAAAPTAQASDRKDGTVATDATTDIVDLYAWMQADSKRVFLVMTVNPDAVATSKFNPNALYVFHTNARANLADPSPAPEFNIVCRFDSNSPQNAECWAGSAAEYIKGPVNTSVLSSKTGNLVVFTGPRNDPYFINQNGLDLGVAFIGTTSSSVTADGAGCKPMSAANLTTLTMAGPTGKLLNGTGPLNAPVDSYKGKNVLAIVLSVDTTLLTQPNKPILTVWGSTNQKL
jgi:hypothetical protein